MKTWRVYDRTSGCVIGYWDGATRAQALDAYARACGYMSFEEVNKTPFGADIGAEEPAWYYHAGVDVGGKVWWSALRPTTDRHEAEAEARSMGDDHGGTPVVEYWDVAHGPHPGPDAVAGMYRVRPVDE